jgi:hypothetical protein
MHVLQNVDACAVWKSNIFVCLWVHAVFSSVDVCAVLRKLALLTFKIVCLFGESK